MVKRKAKANVAAENAPEPQKQKMKAFVHDVCDKHPDFAFARYWYKCQSDREGVRPWFDRKLFPGTDPRFGGAAKVDVLLPPTAPGDLVRIGTLIDRFDDTLPPFEQHAMIQVKIMLDREEAWHVGFERVRSFARSHFAGRFASVLIAHVPGVAGLKGQGNHVHCAVLSRELNINGFGGACTALCSDRGYEAALAAWHDHKLKWETAA